MLFFYSIFLRQGQSGSGQSREHVLPELGGSVPQPRPAADNAHPHQRFRTRPQQDQSAR